MEEQDKVQKLLLDAYNKAPKAVQEFVTSEELARFLKRLTPSYGLSPKSADAASNEILFALLGVTSAKELPVSLEVDANVPPENIDRLVDALEQYVFTPLKEKTAAAAPTTPPKPVPPPVPINRLTPPAPPKLLPKPDAPTPAAPGATLPAVIPTTPVAPKPIVPALKPTITPPVSVPPPPKPTQEEVKPTVAPVPPTPAKKRPGEPSGTPAPIIDSTPKSTDPYREPIE